MFYLKPPRHISTLPVEANPHAALSQRLSVASAGSVTRAAVELICAGSGSVFESVRPSRRERLN